jgi:hypothetical protein
MLDLVQGYWWSNSWSGFGNWSWSGYGNQTNYWPKYGNSSWSWNWGRNSTSMSPYVAPQSNATATNASAPASTTPGPDSLNTAKHRVLVRTFFKDIVPRQAQLINVVMEDTLVNYTAVGTANRNLRTSRELQTFCKTYCNDPKYGCKYCKLNDVTVGADCNNYCHRRESEAASSLPGNDVLATTYVNNRNLFTPQQDGTCAELLATIVSAIADAQLSQFCTRR